MEINLAQIETEATAPTPITNIEKKIMPLTILKPILRHLLTKQYQYIKTKKYDEYSAGHEIIRQLLCSNQFTDEEIDLILKKNQYYEHSTWFNNPENKPRQELIKKDNTDSSFEWLKVNIEKIIIFTGQKSYIQIKISNNDLIELCEDEMLNANKFRQKYFITQGIMLTPIDATAWSYLLTIWQKEKGEKTEKELASEETEARELIIDYIENAGVVTDGAKEKALNYGYVYISQQKIYVLGRTIKSILRKNDLKITQEKLRFVLNEYLLENSTPVKINGISKRFWVFNKQKFDLKDEITDEKEEGVISNDLTN